MEYFLNAAYASFLLAIVALGLAVVFGLMGVINLAHGEFLMLGAYVGLLTTHIFGTFWIGLLLAPLVVAGIGVVIERSLIRRLYRRPLDTIVATFGLAIILREVVRQIAGSDFRSVQDPIGGSVSILGSTFPAYRLAVMAVVLIVVAGIFTIQRKTRLGLVARAVIQNPDLAASIGINVNVVYRWTFAFGAGLAALAGVLVSPTVNVFPDMGPVFVIPAFLAVLVGGVGSFVGLLLAVTALASTQYAVAQMYTPLAGVIALLLLAIAALRFLPDGLGKLVTVKGHGR